jgi:GntR family transcriptional regulator
MPLSSRIAHSLTTAIRQRQISAGARLPSEPELARQLGVSRMSLREALRLLEWNGLLHRRNGVGTFVSARADLLLARGLDELFSTTELIESHGFTAGTSQVEVHQIEANPELAGLLQIEPGSPIIYLRRTRLAGELPVIQCDEYLPASLFTSTGVAPLDLMQIRSLYAFVADRLGQELESANVTVTACAATLDLARRLQVQRGDPLLLLEQVHFGRDELVVLLSRNYHSPERIRFRLTRRKAR